MARAGRAASRVLDDARHLKTHVESSANARPAFGPNYPCSSPNTCPLVVPNGPGGFANKPSGFGTNEQGGFANKPPGLGSNEQGGFGNKPPDFGTNEQGGFGNKPPDFGASQPRSFLPKATSRLHRGFLCLEIAKSPGCFAQKQTVGLYAVQVVWLPAEGANDPKRATRSHQCDKMRW